MRIEVDDLSGPRIAAFLQEHIDEMSAVTPPGSKHALDLDGLRKPDVTFWSVYDEDDRLIGCGAVKELSTSSAEIKSMRTAGGAKRRGVGSELLAFIVEQAAARGYDRLYLETGSSEFFAPARGLYEKFGFEYCEPFAGYELDPNSVHMTKLL